MRPSRVVLGSLLVLPACGDAGDATTPGTTTTVTTPATPGTTADEPTVGAPTTGPTTTGPAPTTGETSEGTSSCMCTPGEVLGCEGPGSQVVCDADCGAAAAEACPPGQACLGADGCVAVACTPGEVACADAGSVHTCADDGSGFGEPVPCAADEACDFTACVSLCALAEQSASSVGCSFFAHTMDNYYAVEADAVVVGNIDAERTATVQLYTRMGGADVAVGAPVEVAPGAVAELELTNPEIEGASERRAEGAYRVASDIPIVAYQHAPIGAQQTNDASMLLPEHALARNYVIASAPEGDTYPGHLSYFVVIAAEDDTVVTWTPPVATLAGAGVPGVPAGMTGQVTLDRLETVQVASAAKIDVSGTIVVADRPVWVMGASACTSVPSTQNTCDHIEEQMLPIETWGQTYVGANAPRRGDEKFYWRVFGGADGVTVTTTPDQTGGPFMLARGEWLEFTATSSFVMTGDRPFLPVQYLESQNGGAGTGDPSTVQMVPVEQFLNAYAFATGTGYDENYVQVIRPGGGPEVLVDGEVVDGYVAVGDYEVADWTIGEGAHLATSEMPFGIINIGYTTVTSYAYPGGMKLAVINPQ